MKTSRNFKPIPAVLETKCHFVLLAAQRADRRDEHFRKHAGPSGRLKRSGPVGSSKSEQRTERTNRYMRSVRTALSVKALVVWILPMQFLDDCNNNAPSRSLPKKHPPWPQRSSRAKRPIVDAHDDARRAKANHPPSRQPKQFGKSNLSQKGTGY
ncbi:hypothetical protein CA13_06600 [Planctomycetes bacterium CA13]|uniref:Uncharacterized protein n=1 Tax=Novipirellula herctigrandis TaxID=2527986 RepID=A0A5C5YW34_9BACT|nr:hypothetical protein CA13_06600 [Planctomycetes bacterium CA13]